MTRPSVHFAALAVVIASAVAAATRADLVARAHAAPGGHRIHGRITWPAGRAIPERPMLEVGRDQGACGHGPIADESLIVNPENRGIANAVVFVDGNRAALPPPAEPAVLDQRGCIFVPHVLVVGRGATVRFANADAVGHVVRALPSWNREFFEGIPAGGHWDFRFDAADAFQVTCSFHGWMSAWIVVRDNPYWAVTDADGRYEIADVPEGAHRVVAWQETIGRLEPRGRRVVVAGADVALDAEAP